MRRVSSELPPLAKIAKEAGDAILLMQDEIVKKAAEGHDYNKGDGSPVTPADAEAHDIVVAGLKNHFPQIPIVSEEGDKEENTQALKQLTRFETDPLDNTKEYINGRGGWSVNIGLIENGVATQGAVYFPKLKKLFYTNNGTAYVKEGDATPKKIPARKGMLRDPIHVAVGYGISDLSHLGDRQHNDVVGSGQYRTCMVATGECDVTCLNIGDERGGYNSWDIAGPHAVLRAAGGEFIDMETKKPLVYKTDGSEKVPDHVAGSKDALIALSIVSQQDLNQGRKLQ